MNYETVFYKAEEEFRVARREFDNALSKMKEDAERKIRLFLATTDLSKNVRDTMLAANEAERLMLEQKEKAALNGTHAPFPLGTKLKRIKRDGHYNEKTVFGVVEAVTRETVLPDSVAYSRHSWRKPSIGSFIVRILKNDGSPSKNFENVYESWEPIDASIERRKPEPIRL